MAGVGGGGEGAGGQHTGVRQERRKCCMHEGGICRLLYSTGHSSMLYSTGHSSLLCTTGHSSRGHGESVGPWVGRSR